MVKGSPDVINATARITHGASQTVLRRAGFSITEGTPTSILMIDSTQSVTRYEVRKPVDELLTAYVERALQLAPSSQGAQDIESIACIHKDTITIAESIARKTLFGFFVSETSRVEEERSTLTHGA